NGPLTVTFGTEGLYHIKKEDPTYGVSRFILSAIHGVLEFEGKYNYFAAMAYVYHLPKLAYNRLMVIFDHQAENGQLPDVVGYWRGSIWVPSTMFIVDGMNQCGERELAREISQKYIDLCVKSDFR